MRKLTTSLAEQKRGLSLVELMVVIAIITVITTIILYGVGLARQNTREKNRLAELAKIEFALTLYNEAHREYPTYDSGAEIGIGGAIDTLLAPYGLGIEADPKSSGSSGSEYAYWYDSDFTCTEAGQKVIFVKTMEQSKNANFDDVCTAASPDTTIAGSDSYITILKQ
jgi:prepilin-type N-terminal cleavage/methylation domain-containing protein